MTRHEYFALAGARDYLERALRYFERARELVQRHEGLRREDWHVAIDALADQTDATIRGMAGRLAELATAPKQGV